MENFLPFALYGSIAVVFVVLAFGVLNLLRTDANARSRSNKLMRLRVAAQFVAVIVLVIIGWTMGAFR